MTAVLKKKTSGHRHGQGEDDVKRKKEDDHLQVKEKGLEWVLPSWPAEGRKPAGILILDFQPRKL